MSSYTPWASLGSTPRPAPGKDEGRPVAGSMHGTKKSMDHAVSFTHKLSKKLYPPDCPPLAVRWYHAIDIPKRKPFSLGPQDPEKPQPVAKKFVPFSEADSRSIEAAFQKLADEEDISGRSRLLRDVEASKLERKDIGDRKDKHGNIQSPVKVPVNEDYLFDVQIEARELSPAYWLGPIYDVKRGAWFFAENPPRPCDENLATQLEEGYLKVEPWKFPEARGRSTSQAPARSSSVRRSDTNAASTGQLPRPSTPKAAPDTQKLAPTDVEHDGVEHDLSPVPSSRAFRLFGTHMNSVVTYEDSTTAYIVTDDLLSRMSSTVYERFAGGAHFSGVKVVRGYAPEAKRSETSSPKPPPSTAGTNGKSIDEPSEAHEATAKHRNSEDARRQAFERKVSNLVLNLQPEEEEEEKVRKQDEEEIRHDYNEDASEDQGREIEHLILITHGIGQRLGLRLESINFIHDVNTLRKTMKAVYNASADLQALNGEVEKLTKNCRVQVLPICWRHLLDFPKRSLQHNREEHDLGTAEHHEEMEYPSLDDITIQGVPAIRNLIMDLGLDILLYQSPLYKAHITKIVLEECNRIYRLFKDRNPTFKGKVSLIGHSLGSAVMFDLLCNQRLETESDSNPLRPRQQSAPPALQLDFEVEDFYALGSPIGLFQMLKGRTIAARQWPNLKIAQTPFPGQLTDPFAAATPSGYSDIFTSSPRCRQLFNIFHPTDPIAYRLEPLISPATAGAPPQPLPYTKRGLFGAPAGQGLTGLGARVGQSVSGLWSSLSSGIASGLLTRGLGLSNEATGRLGDALTQQPSASASAAARSAAEGRGGGGGGSSEAARLPTPDDDGGPEGNDAAAGGPPPLTVEDVKRLLAQESRSLEHAEHAEHGGRHPPTLLNAGLETLYSGFQKQRVGAAGGPEGEAGEGGSAAGEGGGPQRDANRMRREDEKVLALNRNGRVDYSIQEGAFDISLLASLASHLSYWSDEDVSHFIVSQLLSRQRVVKNSGGSESTAQQ